jgi:hypothetical protein
MLLTLVYHSGSARCEVYRDLALCVLIALPQIGWLRIRYQQQSPPYKHCVYRNQSLQHRQCRLYASEMNQQPVYSTGIFMDASQRQL